MQQMAETEVVINQQLETVVVTVQETVITAEDAEIPEPPTEVATEESEEQPAVDANGGEQEEESGNLFGDDDSEDEEVQVDIGEIKINIPQQKAATAATGAKVELDGTPAHKGTMIYDLDLANMEEKPWRKPGADITDYFNYGFNEETWNYYCERQRKLRAEYGGNQGQINRAIFNTISLAQPQLTTTTGGRQLVNICGPDKPQKVNKLVIDLSKPPPIMESAPIMRTVLTGSSSMSDMSQPNFSAPPPSSMDTPTPVSAGISTPNGSSANISIPTLDFSKPPPSLEQITSVVPSVANPTPHDLPPGVDEPGPPGAVGSNLPIPSLGGMTASIDTSIPPPGFDPKIPPPGIPQVRLGGIPGMNIPPPSLYGMPNHSAAGFSSGPPFGRPPPLLAGRGGYGGEREYDRRERGRSSSESGGEDDYGRRKRRRRSRSRSVDRMRRRDDRDRDRDSRRHERKDDRDRDRDRSERKRGRSREKDSEERDRKRKKHERSEKSDKRRSSHRDERKDRQRSPSREIKEEVGDAVEEEDLRPPGED